MSSHNKIRAEKLLEKLDDWYASLPLGLTESTYNARKSVGDLLSWISKFTDNARANIPDLLASSRLAAYQDGNVDEAKLALLDSLDPHVDYMRLKSIEINIKRSIREILEDRPSDPSALEGFNESAKALANYKGNMPGKMVEIITKDAEIELDIFGKDSEQGKKALGAIQAAKAFDQEYRSVYTQKREIVEDNSLVM